MGDYFIREFVFCEKDFGSTPFWDLNPEVGGSLWQMASVTLGGIHFG